jgi:hypothetical protein
MKRVSQMRQGRPHCHMGGRWLRDAREDACGARPLMGAGLGHRASRSLGRKVDSFCNLMTPQDV